MAPIITTTMVAEASGCLDCNCSCRCRGRCCCCCEVDKFNALAVDDYMCTSAAKDNLVAIDSGGGGCRYALPPRSD